MAIGTAIGIPFKKGGQSWSSYWTTITFQSVQPAVIAQVSLTLKAEAAGHLILNWGDGSADVVLTADGHDHTYTSAYTGNNTTYNITITGYVYYLKKFLLANNTTVALNISDFRLVGLSYLELDTLTGAITGSLNDLPTTLNYLKLDTVGSLLTGSVTGTNLSYLAYIELVDHPLITGNLQSLSQYLIYTILDNCPLIAGNINSFGANHRTISLIDLAQTITGSIDNLPHLQLNYLVLDNLGSLIIGSIDTLVITSDQYIDGLTTINIYATSNTDAFTGSLTTLRTNNPNLTSLILVNLGNNITGDAGAFAADYVIDSSTSVLNIAITSLAGATKELKLIGRSGRKPVLLTWGDGTSENLVMDDTEKTVTHTYVNAGTYNFVLSNGYNLTRFTIGANKFSSSVGNINQFAGFKNLILLYISTTGGTWTGSLNSFANVPLIALTLAGVGSAINGSIDNLSHITTTVYLSGISNTTTGSAKNLHASLTTLTLHAMGTTVDIKTGPHPAWAATTIQFMCSHLPADVDAFLISWATTAGAGTKTITLTRTRTSASDAAVTTLNGLGKTINTSG